MPFEVFMERCLYDPEGGFFATGPLRSTKSGDFLTSPEVSPWFGRIMARFVRTVDERLGEPGDIVEVGAGSGSLLAALFDELESRTAYAVEASPAAREALVALGERVVVHATPGELPQTIRGTVIANELLDNLPVALAQRAGTGFEERWVGVEREQLTLVGVPIRPEVADWVTAFAGVVPTDGIVEVQIAAGEWLQAMLHRLDRGALVIIDYGGTAEELEPRRSTGTLRTYRAHHLGPDPLVEPGATDITVDVNFTALLAIAEAAGAAVELVRQDDFLERCGLMDVVGELRRRELELARSGDEMHRLVVRSELRDAETLLHPRGLGDFRVLVASK